MAVGVGVLGGADFRIERLPAQECWSGPKLHGTAAANCCAALPVFDWMFLLRQPGRPCCRVNRDYQVGSQRQARNRKLPQSRRVAAQLPSDLSLHYFASRKGGKTVGSRMPLLVEGVVHSPLMAQEPLHDRRFQPECSLLIERIPPCYLQSGCRGPPS